MLTGDLSILGSIEDKRIEETVGLFALVGVSFGVVPVLALSSLLSRFVTSGECLVFVEKFEFLKKNNYPLLLRGGLVESYRSYMQHLLKKSSPLFP